MYNTIYFFTEPVGELYTNYKTLFANTMELNGRVCLVGYKPTGNNRRITNSPEHYHRTLPTLILTIFDRFGPTVANPAEQEMLPIEVLNHELDHALEYDNNPTQQLQNGKTKDINYGNKEEKRVITGSEQSTAKKLGKLKEREVTRNNHNGSTYETISPISTEDKFSIKPHNE